MTSWSNEELTPIAEADELRVQPRRADGSLREPTPIWVVRDGADLYVRSYRGPDGVWWRTAKAGGAGRVQAGGVTRDVAFTAATDPELNDRLDAAYRAKYGRYSATYVDPMVAEPARATTLRLSPR
ncbi:DUF2255 family protein [Streptomyces hoynatensis]|uniref:DUF2255 family protein n=1 Tax=Streptomyces hoynatensis TaxID=1141874 RepID=A0A3A9Z5Y7_9ACTN|nr:DUF2255 family protein [Streptomyces hoynatensis]RKN43801.1 DUF2255 family protein [Streptomyces hoynatensis]